MSYNMQGLGVLLEMYGESICKIKDSQCLGRTIGSCRNMICHVQYGGQDPEKEEAQVKEIQSLEKQLSKYKTGSSSYKQKKEIESKIQQLKKEIGGNTGEIGNKLLSRSLIGVTRLQRKLIKGLDQIGKKQTHTSPVPPRVFNRRNAITPPSLPPSSQYIPKAKDCNTILKQQGILDNDYKTTRRNFKKWALKNHPDKGGNTSVFQSVSDCSDKSDSTDSTTGLELLKSPTSSASSSTPSSGLKSIGWTSTTSPTSTLAASTASTAGLKSIGWTSMSSDSTKETKDSEIDSKASSNVDLKKLDDSYDKFKTVILNRKNANEKQRKAFEPVKHPSPWKL